MTKMLTKSFRNFLGTAPFARLASSIQRFRLDGHGGVAVIFGLAIVPLAGCVAFGVEYSRLQRARTRNRRRIGMAPARSSSERHVEVNRRKIDRELDRPSKSAIVMQRMCPAAMLVVPLGVRYNEPIRRLVQRSLRAFSCTTSGNVRKMRALDVFCASRIRRTVAARATGTCGSVTGADMRQRNRN